MSGGAVLTGSRGAKSGVAGDWGAAESAGARVSKGALAMAGSGGTMSEVLP
jgi:hypothetical protein